MAPQETHSDPTQRLRKHSHKVAGCGYAWLCVADVLGIICFAEAMNCFVTGGLTNRPGQTNRPEKKSTAIVGVPGWVFSRVSCLECCCMLEPSFRSDKHR